MSDVVGSFLNSPSAKDFSAVSWGAVGAVWVWHVGAGASFLLAAYLYTVAYIAVFSGVSVIEDSLLDLVWVG